MEYPAFLAATTIFSVDGLIDILEPKYSLVKYSKLCNFCFNLNCRTEESLSNLNT